MAFWRIRATVDDRPGFLSVLTASLALRAVNILSVQVHATEAGAVDDFLVDAPDALGEADLLAAVAKGRGRDAWVGRTDVRGLVDAQTQLLGLAARLVPDPDELGSALVALLGECRVSWLPGPCPVERDFGGGPIRLPDPNGGTLLVERAEPPFTPAEFARAHALVDLAATVVRQSALRWQLLLPDGDELTVRPAGPEDVEGVVGLHAECSARSRYRRYLSGSATPDASRLARLLCAPQGTTLIAERESELRVVAMANLICDGTEAECGLLVADGYQRRGVGTALLHRLVRLATGTGIETLHAHTHADNDAMIATMRRLGRPLRVTADGRLLTLSVDLRPTAGAEAAGTQVAGIEAAGAEAAGIEVTGIDAAGIDVAGIDVTGIDPSSGAEAGQVTNR
jgi:GNAT superfamily N-acetyltransferase